MGYLVDSSAWIEYLEGSKEGEKVWKLLEKEKIYSLSLIIAEVVSKIKRNNKNVDLAYRILSSNSEIIEITPNIAKEAGLFHAERRKKIKNFGLVDAIILVCAKKFNVKVLTGDNHFKGFKEAILL